MNYDWRKRRNTEPHFCHKMQLHSDRFSRRTRVYLYFSAFFAAGAKSRHCMQADLKWPLGTVEVLNLARWSLQHCIWQSLQRDKEHTRVCAMACTSWKQRLHDPDCFDMHDAGLRNEGTIWAPNFGRKAVKPVSFLPCDKTVSPCDTAVKNCSEFKRSKMRAHDPILRVILIAFYG